MKPDAPSGRGQEGVPEWELVQRIILSAGFVRSPRLTALLLYLVERKLRGGLGELTETLVAINVFERPADYNPAEDSIVRTHVRLLRQKLDAYFRGEGAAEDLVLEIPKGGYVPSFISRRPPPPASRATAAGNRRVILAAVAVLMAAAFVGGLWAGSRWFTPRSGTASAAHGSNLVNMFWKGFLNKDESVVLAYTNSVFLTTENGDLLRFRGGAVADRGVLVGKEDSSTTALNPALAQKAGPVYYEDGFTGTGEVLAVHDLTQVFSELGVKVVVKRNRLVSADDLRNHDLVFLGSKVLEGMRLPHRFSFQWPVEPPYLWRGRIIDNAPAPSQPRSYELERDPATGVIRADYAVFDVLPGVTPARRTMVIAGLTTSGTQGAAEFATTQAGLGQILRAIGVQHDGTKAFPPFFECMLRVEAAKGLDVVKVKYVTGAIVPPSE